MGLERVVDPDLPNRRADRRDAKAAAVKFFLNLLDFPVGEIEDVRTFNPTEVKMFDTQRFEDV